MVIIFSSSSFCCPRMCGVIFFQSTNIRGIFHQHSTNSFYASKSQKCQKKLLNLTVIFAILGSALVKSARKLLVKLTPDLVKKNLTTHPIYFDSTLFSTSLFETIIVPTICIRDLDKLNLIVVFWFYAQANFHYYPRCLKFTFCIQSGQK